MIISDSSPLIYLSRSGHLRLLKSLYKGVIASQGIAKEVLIEGKPGTGAIQQAFEDGWLKLAKESSGTPSPTQGITGSDAEVLSLAENRGVALLTNDRALFHCAKARGIRCKWLSLVVVEGIEEGLLTPDEGEKILTDMVHAGLRIRSEVFAELISRIRSL